MTSANCVICGSRQLVVVVPAPRPHCAICGYGNSLAHLDNTASDGDLVRWTQAELAAEVGTTREVVARCLAGLQMNGAVRLGRGRVTVLSREKLAAEVK